MPAPAAEAFHRTQPAPLPKTFNRWHGPCPQVKEVREQTGAWDAAGQDTHRAAGRWWQHARGADQRRPAAIIRLSAHRSQVRGPVALLVDYVVGEWIFTAVAGGTEITWRWDIHAKSPLTSWALPLFGRMRKGYAQQALRDLSAILTG